MQKGLKWHKLQVYAGLWLSSVYSVLTGWSVMNGMQYGDMAAEVYSFIDGLKAIDVIYGVLLIGIAVLTVIARFHLAAMHKSGVRWLTAMYWLKLGAELFYAVAAGSLAEAVLETIMAKASVFIVVALLFVINFIYYKKREHLFTEA